MSSDGTSSTDGRTLTAAIENFAERLDGLIGAVDRLTNCLSPMPYEYGPSPPYPPSIVNLVVVEGMDQAEFPSDGQIQTTTSSSSSSSDSSEDSSTSSWDEESDSTMARALSDVFKMLDPGLYHQLEFDEDDDVTLGRSAGLPTDIISTRSARENSSREGEEDDIVGSTGDEPDEQIDDEEEEEHTCTKCSEDEDNGKDDDEDDIQTARSVPSETDLTVKKEARSI